MGAWCTATAARRPSSATSSSTPTGRRARGAARTTAAWRRSCRATRSAPRGCGSRARTPNSALGRALDSGREITGALVTELAHDGDPPAADVMRMMGERLGLGVVSLVNIFNPEVVVVGGGAIAAGELLLAPAREVVAARALPINRARRAARAGPLRRRVGDARRGVHGPRRGGGGGRHERAAHRLPDADRQPRGRHAAGALGAARGRRDRLRGHAHDEGAARPLRGVGRARALRRARRAARGAASWWSGCARAPSWRWSAMPGCRW